MALFDLNRSNDTPISTLKLSTIVPVNWHKFPPAMPSTTPGNQNAAKPRYDSMTDWAGGAIGDDISAATATVALARSGGGANEPDYAPRTQAAKAALPGTVPPNAVAGEPDFSLVVDIGRPRGAIEPDDPYPKVGDTPPAAPVISSLAPNTAVAVTGPDLVVTITGTGFTPWSTVTSGNFPIPARYISATKLEIIQKPRSSVAGVVTVVVTDHGVASAPSNFTFT